MMINDTLFIIPARGGSKGIPKKNIVEIVGKPMIGYTIEAAQEVTNNNNIIVSTDDLNIKSISEQYGLDVPFIRPKNLASDTADSRSVVLHALDFMEQKNNKKYSRICLLQPTSPLRSGTHILEAFNTWDDALDMVVSVNESKANPYFNLFEEDKNSFLRKSKRGTFTRRQDAPKIWEYNGAIYIIKPNSIRTRAIHEFNYIKKYVMNQTASIDIDNEFDLLLVDKLIREQ